MQRQSELHADTDVPDDHRVTHDAPGSDCGGELLPRNSLQRHGLDRQLYLVGYGGACGHDIRRSHSEAHRLAYDGRSEHRCGDGD
jgi:hypothetical protein